MPRSLETKRLLLRPFTMDDVDAAYEVLEGHPDVWKYDPGYARTWEQRAGIIHQYTIMNAPDDVGTLAVTLRESGQLIGYVGLQLYVLPSEPLATAEVELFYKLGRTYWGQGYAAEACREMIRFAFEEMRLARIVTVTDRRNEPSIRLLRRLGMTMEEGPDGWPDSLLGVLHNDRRKDHTEGETQADG
jgi:RimJ/RimL family protein N-acetyltransferase